MQDFFFYVFLMFLNQYSLNVKKKNNNNNNPVSSSIYSLSTNNNLLQITFFFYLFLFAFLMYKKKKKLKKIYKVIIFSPFLISHSQKNIYKVIIFSPFLISYIFSKTLTTKTDTKYRIVKLIALLVAMFYIKCHIDFFFYNSMPKN